jgi:hypothetical protein
MYLNLIELSGMDQNISFNESMQSNEIGGIAYLLANLSVYLPYTVMYSVAALFGLLGD